MPIFLMRGFRQRCFFVRTDSPLRAVSDLRNKRVGINEWPATGNTWARALLRDQGVDIWSVRWLVGQVSEGHKPPPNDPLPSGVERESKRMLVEMLAVGDIDALVCPWPPTGFDDAHSQVRRLYPEFVREEQAITSAPEFTLDTTSSFSGVTWCDAHPEIVGALYRAFDEARRFTESSFRATAEIVPWLLSELEQDTRLMGQDLHPYGVAPNRHMIEAFVSSSSSRDS
ncbi:MAG: hypothetical protein LC797_02105 [Chloroflexi bacterium]|nr:hypothetical protein [Chloroflexota bacterium]